MGSRLSKGRSITSRKLPPDRVSQLASRLFYQLSQTFVNSASSLFQPRQEQRQQQQQNPSESESTARSSSSPAINAPTMSEQELRTLLSQIHQSLRTHDYTASLKHLTRAKLILLSLNALVPSPQVPQSALLLARETLELGALTSIRRQDDESFTRYFAQLQPFYDLPPSQLPREGSNQSKITGLHLLLLLSQGDYAGFHTVLESLELAAAITEDDGRGGIERDGFIQYPVKLEQWLMEGSYDKVWGATKSEKVPSEEYGIFSEVLNRTIRSEIASCSEKAYPSLPITDAKSLLFLDSEGSVVDFAHSRGWAIHDGRIYFPASQEQGLGTEKEILLASGQVIENTIGYARELETIV